MATTAITVVLNELTERRDVLTQALAGGSAKDFAEYNHMCGEIRGLSYAHAIINDLVRQMENDDE